MKKIKEYFNIQKELYEYFGYQEDWVVFPMQDYTNFWWGIPDENLDSVVTVMADGTTFSLDYENNFYFCDDEESAIKLVLHNWNWEKANVNCYHYEIYHQRFLETPIFRGKDYSMIVVDTHTDGNRYMVILDNKKEVSKKIIRKNKIKKVNESS